MYIVLAYLSKTYVSYKEYQHLSIRVPNPQTTFMFVSTYFSIWKTLSIAQGFLLRIKNKGHGVFSCTSKYLPTWSLGNIIWII